MSQPLKTNDVVSDALKTSPEELARAKFEAWWPVHNETTWDSYVEWTGERYTVAKVQRDWEIWQAASPAPALLEQAARQIADSRYLPNPPIREVYESRVLQILRDTIGK